MNKNDFKMTNDWIMLDNAAITFKPQVMIDVINDFYTSKIVNPHSKDSALAQKIIGKIFETRKTISKLVNSNPSEVIFTSGATHSSNLLIGAISREITKKDEIILFRDCHASLFIPFLEIRDSKKCKINFVTLEHEIEKVVNENTKVIAYSQINNATGAVHNYKYIYKIIKNIAPNCIIINDVAQAISHVNVDFKYSDALLFSGGKIYGPTGIGALVMKNHLITRLNPYQFGGGMHMDFNENEWTSKKDFNKWEAGTQNIAGILGLNASIKYILNIGIDKINKYENALSLYLYDELNKINDIKIFSKKGSPIILFYLRKINSHDLSSYIGHNKILTRSGLYCANLIRKVINNNKPTIRISLGLYNNKNDIDKLIYFIKKGDILNGII